MLEDMDYKLWVGWASTSVLLSYQTDVGEQLKYQPLLFLSVQITTDPWMKLNHRRS